MTLATLSSCSLWRASPNSDQEVRPWLRKKRGRKSGPVRSSIAEVSKVLGFSDAQRQRLERDGLVVMTAPREYGSVPSPIYDRIYQHDLPVLITSDSILYAFHRRYVEFLAEIEGEQLSGLLGRVLGQTRGVLKTALAQGQLDSSSAVELDVYLTVAQSLLQGPIAPALKATPRRRIKDAIAAIQNERNQDFEIFGRVLPSFDFSQFKPRGHYRRSKKLRRYFRTVMWLSRVRLDLITFPEQRAKLERKNFETAATLAWLIQKGKAKEELESYHGILDDFVGPADDENPVTLGSFLKGHKIRKPSQLKKISDEQINAWLASTQEKRSRIASHFYVNSKETPKSKIPRAFMMIGQRFTLDAHLLSNLVYDRLVDPKNPALAIKRMMPKSLDVMAALGNPRAKYHLRDEFKRYNYEGALDQLASQVKAKPQSFWSANVHSGWLDAIASLHEKADDPRLPEVFRTPAWKDKTLQTQLASWAELRHDHILYVKQSMSFVIGCEFPDAYVEPVPHFFAKVKHLISKLHAVTDKLETQGFKIKKELHEELILFSQVLDRLHTIADKELRHERPNREEMHFLKQAVESETVGCGSYRWDGWYPRLLGETPTADFHPTVADVHTDPPSEQNNMTRRVLHVGTGRFELATIAIDCPGNKKCVYVGPVSTFYELIPERGQRLTDERWATMLEDPSTHNARPAWIKSFHVELSRTQKLVNKPEGLLTNDEIDELVKEGLLSSEMAERIRFDIQAIEEEERAEQEDGLEAE